MSSLGYILGDEGSGAVLGKLFVNGMFKGNIPAEVREEFLATTGQSLDDMVTPADVVPLMEDDVALLLLGQGRGQIYLWTKNSHDKRGFDVVRQINVTLQRHGAHQSPAEPLSAFSS